MQLNIIALVLAIVVTLAMCQTTITDNDIAGTMVLTKSGSPYTFEPRVGITVTITGNLEVEAGVIVRVAEYVTINANNLISTGTVEEPIIFTGINRTQWLGLSITYLAQLSFTTIEKLGGEFRVQKLVAIDSTLSNIRTIECSNGENQLIRTNVVNVSSLNAIAYRATVSQSTFTNIDNLNVGYNIITNSVFENVHSGGLYGAELDSCLFKSAGAYSDATKITNSNFMEGSFRVNQYSNLARFIGNRVFNCSFFLEFGQGKMNDNVFYDVSEYYYSTIVMASSGSFNNNIFMNMSNRYSYHIFESNSGSGAIDATNNYWNGFTDNTNIDSLIYDMKDDSSKNLVVYKPALTVATIPEVIERYYNRNLTNAGDWSQCVGQKYCSFNGDCVGLSKCICYEGYAGADCSVPTCGWKNDDSLNAPTPVVVVTYNKDNILFDITMKNNALSPFIVHHISLDRLVLDWNETDLHADVLSVTTCDTKYRVSIPWSSDSIERTLLADQVLQMKVTVYIYYILDELDNSFVEFTNTKTFYTQLKSTAFAMISTHVKSLVDMKLQRFWNDKDGNIQIDALLTLASNDLTLNSISHLNSTSGTELSIEYSRISTSTEYNVRMTPVNSAAELTGKYVLDVSINQGGIRSSYLLEFDIYIDSIVPSPPSNLTMETVITIRKTLSGSQQSLFEYGETPYINTALKPSMPQLSSGQQLSVESAYLCCMFNNGPMPNYDPTNGQYGCTTYDSSTMEYWTQLVQSGLPSSLSTQMHTSNARSAVFSFNIDSLTDQQRTCYIHVATELKNAVRRRSINSVDDSSISYGTFAIQMKDTVNSGAHPSVTILLTLLLVFIAML
jgi:hypothetical protein